MIQSVVLKINPAIIDLMIEDFKAAKAQHGETMHIKMQYIINDLINLKSKIPIDSGNDLYDSLILVAIELRTSIEKVADSKILNWKVFHKLCNLYSVTIDLCYNLRS